MDEKERKGNGHGTEEGQCHIREAGARRHPSRYRRRVQHRTGNRHPAEQIVCPPPPCSRIAHKGVGFHEEVGWIRVVGITDGEVDKENEDEAPSKVELAQGKCPCHHRQKWVKAESSSPREGDKDRTKAQCNERKIGRRPQLRIATAVEEREAEAVHGDVTLEREEVRHNRCRPQVMSVKSNGHTVRRLTPLLLPSQLTDRTDRVPKELRVPARLEQVS